MKAYRATTEHIDTHEFVFAETASKARAAAYGLDGLGDAEFIDIKITRVKGLDKFFTGKNVHLDWKNTEVQRFFRNEGWWVGDNFALCDSCGLYEYDDLKESYLEETEEGLLCVECANDNREDK